MIYFCFHSWLTRKQKESISHSKSYIQLKSIIKPLKIATKKTKEEEKINFSKQVRVK